MTAAAVSGGGTAAAGAPLDDNEVGCGSVRVRAAWRAGDRGAARRAVVVVFGGGGRTDELEVSETVSARRVAFAAGGSGKPLLIEASVPPWADGGVSPRRPAIVVFCCACVRVCVAPWERGARWNAKKTIRL